MNPRAIFSAINFLRLKTVPRNSPRSVPILDGLVQSSVIRNFLTDLKFLSTGKLYCEGDVGFEGLNACCMGLQGLSKSLIIVV